MVPPATIHLGLDRVLSKKDISRALICSTAVYAKSNEVAKLYLQGMLNDDRSITFDKVHMSLRDRVQNVLVAYATDAIFIAFKGTDSLMDIGADLMVDSHLWFWGSFHRGFFNRASSFMDLPERHLNPIADLIDTDKRIIFCGHSLGGAVAHTVLLRFWLESRVQPTETTCPDSLFSVAFGAPQVCDAHIADKINCNANLKWRFINFVNQSDPVPRLLHNLKSTVAAALRPKLEEADNIYKSIGGFSGDCIAGYVEDGIMGAFGAATMGTARRASAAIGSQVKRFGYLALGGKSSPSGLNPKEPDFHPVGQYIYLQKDKHNRLVAEKFYGSDHRMWRFLENEIQLTDLDLGLHKSTSYWNVLVESAFIDGHGDPASSSTYRQSQLIDISVETPPPKVTFAKWAVNENLTQRSIIIRGQNLLFLSQSVTVFGSEGERSWMVTLQTDKELRILDPHGTDPMQESIGSDTALPLISVVTAFGQTACTYIHRSYSDTKAGVGVPEMLAKIVQTYRMKATPPYKLAFHTRQLVKSELDGIMLCAPSLRHSGTQNLSQYFEKLMKCEHNDQNGQIEHVSQEINAMVHILEKYLTSMLEVSYISSNSEKNLEVAVKAAVFSAVLCAPVSLTGALILWGSSQCLMTLGVILKPKQLADYIEVLQEAIRETSEWLPEAENKDGFKLNGTEEAGALEKILHRQVTQSSSQFKALVEKAHDGKDPASLPRFKSKLFRNASSESSLSLLRRIKVVHGVLSLYKAEVEKTHMLGVFGAEDAGKSTFIKKVLEKYNRRSEMPRTGVDMHTTAVRPYAVTKSLWLVDFPGSDTLEAYADSWEQFTALPSSSILLLDYEGDIKREYVDMYQKMKSKLGSHAQVTIVLNKVDMEFSSTDPSERTHYTKEYFENQRTEIEVHLGCVGKDKVYLACVQPAVLEDFAVLNSKLGVSGFEDLVTSLISPYVH